MLENYGFYPSDLAAACDVSREPYMVIKALFQDERGGLNGLPRVLLDIHGEKGFIEGLAEILGNNSMCVEDAFHQYMKECSSVPIILTGAETVALIMRQENIENIFAYPGTSELAICDCIARMPNLNLFNGRGDKECAFMAAGGCILSPTSAVAVLHGARGLTNAAGAIADVRRNEIGTIIFVGLPSTASSPFLPPHGEPHLMKSMGNFAKEVYEITELANSSDSPEEVERKSCDFVIKVKQAIAQSKSLPLGPILIGIPQDAIENRWIRYEILATSVVTKFSCYQPVDENIEEVCQLIKEKKHPLILVDDLLFKNHKAKERLVALAETIGAPVLQINYRRGPMLFERISSAQNPYFAGPYNPDNKWHQRLMMNADLIITLEDRNAYPRVVGQLPSCRKIAITSNHFMTKKNGYLTRSDLLVEGDVTEIVTRIISALVKTSGDKRKELKYLRNYCREIRGKLSKSIKTQPEYDFMRIGIAEELAKIFKKSQHPILVDDSQMFGGILLENYEKFPIHLHIFGDHGGFVGSGIAYSAGLALSSGKHSVFCTLGDQAFTNGFQGLVAVGQENIKIIYLVCNNGKSVSLLKQLASQNAHALNQGQHPFLINAPNLNYSDIAKDLGLFTFRIKFDPNSTDPDISNPIKLFKDCLLDALGLNGPVLIELELPSSLDAWSGIWATKGNENINYPLNKRI